MLPDRWEKRRELPQGHWQHGADPEAAGSPATELRQQLLSWISVPASLLSGRYPYRQPEGRKICCRLQKFTGIFPGNMSSAGQIIGSRTEQTLRLGGRSVNIRRSRIPPRFLNFRNLPGTD
jgi:hypothetical protein